MAIKQASSTSILKTIFRISNITYYFYGDIMYYFIEFIIFFIYLHITVKTIFILIWIFLKLMYEIYLLKIILTKDVLFVMLSSLGKLM